MAQEKHAHRPLNERIGFWLTLIGLLLAIISIALYIWALGFSQPVFHTANWQLRLTGPKHRRSVSLWLPWRPLMFCLPYQVKQEPLQRIKNSAE
jgi:hypothetical protein